MLKITELKAAFKAACSELTAANMVDRTGSAPRTVAALVVYDATNAAMSAEYDAAQDLKKKFYERGDTTTGAGITNAGDTFGGHHDSEFSTEYWKCAIDSVQFMLDCEPSTVLEKDVK